MRIRKEVLDVVSMGPIPSSDKAEPEDVDRRGAALDRIARPVNDEEAALLLKCFGPDDCFGLAWTLLHTIETAPGGSPVKTEPPPEANEWIRRLWRRAENARHLKEGT